MADIAGLYYEEHGPADAEPLLLSPGLGGLGSFWRPNIAALAERYRVIVFDHRGTGHSDRMIGDTVDIADIAADMLRLLDGLGIDRAHIAGQAAGGLAGLVIALDAPARIWSLTVINGWSRPDAHLHRCCDLRLALLHDGGADAYLRAQPIFIYPARWIPEHEGELAAEAALHLAEFAGVATMEKRIEMLRRFDIDDRLGEIGAPVLLISAEDDMLVLPSCSERLAAGIPDAEHVALRFGGHACSVTNAARVNALMLDFLSRHPIGDPPIVCPV